MQDSDPTVSPHVPAEKRTDEATAFLIVCLPGALTWGPTWTGERRRERSLPCTRRSSVTHDFALGINAHFLPAASMPSVQSLVPSTCTA